MNNSPYDNLSGQNPGAALGQILGSTASRLQMPTSGPMAGLGTALNSLRTGENGLGMGAKGAAPSQPAGYQRLATPDRQALLNAMLMRARGGQAGGAPASPLPAPNSNVPTT